MTRTLATLTTLSALASVFHVHPLTPLAALLTTGALLLAYLAAASRDVDAKLSQR